MKQNIIHGLPVFLVRFVVALALALPSFVIGETFFYYIRDGGYSLNSLAYHAKIQEELTEIRLDFYRLYLKHEHDSLPDLVRDERFNDVIIMNKLGEVEEVPLYELDPVTSEGIDLLKEYSLPTRAQLMAKILHDRMNILNKGFIAAVVLFAVSFIILAFSFLRHRLLPVLTALTSSSAHSNSPELQESS